MNDLLRVRTQTLGYLIAGLHAYPIAAHVSNSVEVRRWYVAVAGPWLSVFAGVCCT